ncbi:acetoacetate--CoA ligase, partial [bacterium]|nr:acetoacetate--CoA ligase [bacterium]
MGSGSSTIGAAGEQPVPPVLWEPSAATIGRSRIAAFIAWLHEERGLHFADYEELRRWSVADLEGFWSAIWEFFGVRADGSPTPVLGSEEMPGA